MALTETLTDSFTGPDGPLNASKWTKLGTASIVGNVCNCPIVGTTYSGLVSVNTYSLVNSYVYMKVGLPAASTNRDFSLSVHDSANNGAWIIIDGSPTRNITWRRRQAAVNTNNSRAYNPATDVWVRIRMSGTTLFWSTSPDGVTWTELQPGGLTTTTDMSVVYVESTHGQWIDDGVSSPGTIDNINTLGNPLASSLGLTSATDLQKAYHVAGGGSTTDSISDNERSFFGATAIESLADARRRFIMANAGGLITDSLEDLNRKYYASIVGVLPASETNTDAEYRMYKTLVP